MISTEPTKSSYPLNTLISFFVFLLLISIGGFYKTYIVKFPDFAGFTVAHHLHATVMLIWIFILILQPVLIRAKHVDWHRRMGKLTYFIFPILVFSFFLVARASYFKTLENYGQENAWAGMANGIPDMFYISILYGFGIYYKKKTSFHLRFFAAIGLMIMGPGLGRFLIVFCGLPFMIAIPLMIGITTLAAISWLITDLIKKRSAFPMSVFLGTIIAAFLIHTNSHSSWWQGFAKWVAGTCF